MRLRTAVLILILMLFTALYAGEPANPSEVSAEAAPALTKTQEIERLFSEGDYDRIDKLILKLPENTRNTLYFKSLLLEVLMSKKRFKQAIEILDEIKLSYPTFYISENLEALRGDIALYRRQFDAALEAYDKSLKVKKSHIVAFNRILTLEKQGKPSTEFIPEYIDYLEKYPNSIFAGELVERLVSLKKSKNVLTSGASYYVRWLAVLNRSGRMKELFNEDFLTLGYPVAIEVVNYLNGEKRYGDSLKILDDCLAKQQKSEDRYIIIDKKYRTLVQQDRDIEAAELLVGSSGEFNAVQKERFLFLAAILYFENGVLDKSGEIFREFVFQRPKSRYFLLSLYKLGLIHLRGGEVLKAYELWSNFVPDESLNPNNYSGGKKAYESILGLLNYISRLNGFSPSPDFIFAPECGEDLAACKVGSDKLVISYYDFLYLDGISHEAFKKREWRHEPEKVEAWRKNVLTESAVKEDLLQLLSKVSQKAKKSEAVRMLNYFLNEENYEGVEFYVAFMRYLNSFSVTRQSETLSSLGISIAPEKIDELSSVYSEILTTIHLTYNSFLGKASKTSSYYYDKLIPDLTYSPHWGKADEWKLIYPTPFFDEILEYSGEFNIPPQLVYSIMRAETHYGKLLFSAAGAMGLMQIMPKTFGKIKAQSGMDISDPLDPRENIRAGAWYLSRLLQRFDGNLFLAVAAYNAGPHKVSEWLKKYGKSDGYVFIELIPYAETRDYVKKVLRFFSIYSYLYEGDFYDLDLRSTMNVTEKPEYVDF
ncbi:transglycosylase SLT domain-containing protein [bacterium]|nr:transglycosylase SLT domain-containing protein [bacterium]